MLLLAAYLLRSFAARFEERGAVPEPSCLLDRTGLLVLAKVALRELVRRLLVPVEDLCGLGAKPVLSCEPLFKSSVVRVLRRSASALALRGRKRTALRSDEPEPLLLRSRLSPGFPRLRA